ncbi:MAG: phosphatidylserine decarboxylase [Desulfobacteraceae bacterium]|nr:MAG: phosphatidylserine decarboxylase [Desulfobacteraceae bacterium]
MNFQTHQYIARETGAVQTEALFADSLIAWIYGAVLDKADWLFNALISCRASKMLAWLNYDMCSNLDRGGVQHIIKSLNIDPEEILDDISRYQSLRNVFERKIRYESCRSMPQLSDSVVSPADARLLLGFFLQTSSFFIKEKFFDYSELIGVNRQNWLSKFADGDVAIFRLTPDKYHYNHVPVSGVVADHYEISGRYHSCNPGAVVSAVTPLSKNRRIITIIDTDTHDGTCIGCVAMIEVVALMIGDIVQCYSDIAYDDPKGMTVDMPVRKGQPKSMYRPGSSTTVLIFEKGRIRFSEDLLQNLFRQDFLSRFSKGFGKTLVETDVRVRSEIGRRV